MSSADDPRVISRTIKVLLVEDDQASLVFTEQVLQKAGYQVWSAPDGRAALETLEQRGLPHIALIDIMMPRMDGLELARKIQEFVDLPIIMLTSVERIETKVDALTQFAEDYVVKPFEPKELLARIDRLLRRIGDFSYTLEPRVRIDDRLSVEFARRRVIVEGRETELTPTESKLLYVLMRSAGRTLLSEYLLKRVWAMGEVYEDTLRTHVYRLRRKIENSPNDPRYVLTERGLGYSFVKPGSES